MLIEHDHYGNSQPALTILHGLLGSKQNWRKVAGILQSSHTVCVPTLRNHGDSPHGPHSIGAMQKDVIRLHDHLGIQCTNILGHSMGGLVAMSIALARPKKVQSLVVVDVLPKVELARLTPVLYAMGSLELDKITRLAQADRALAQKLPDSAVRRFILKNLKRKADGTYAWTCNLTELSRWVRENAQVDLASDGCYEGSTLFIAGGKSEHQIARRQDLIAQYFPNYELAVIPNAGHWVHFDAARQFIDIVLSFYSEHMLD